MERMITFGQFARRQRLAHGLSQQVCAAALGMRSRSSFTRLEQAKSWRLEHVWAFAFLLNLSTSRLLAAYEEANSVPCTACRGTGRICNAVKPGEVH
jgi:transcriptional regulator with XRE-family HTH domain